MSEAVFALVGHPNKGKSSLVAALARDERVGIAPRHTAAWCEALSRSGPARVRVVALHEGVGA